MTEKQTGTLKECRQHFYQTQPLITDLDQLALLADVDTITAGRWLAGERLPKALHKLTVITYLRHHGYTVTEVANSPAPVQELGRDILLGSTTLQKVQRALGYARHQTVTNILLGRHNPSAEKLAKIIALNKSTDPVDSTVFYRKPVACQQ